MDTDEETVIVGDVIETAPDEVTNEGDTTIIVETPSEDGNDDAVDAVVVATEIDLAQRVAVLETELAAMRNDVFDASLTAEVALNQAQAAQEQDAAIVEAVDEAIVETIEGAEIEDTDGDGDDEIVTDEHAPVSQRIHPLFRPLSEWRNR